MKRLYSAGLSLALALSLVSEPLPLIAGSWKNSLAPSPVSSLPFSREAMAFAGSGVGYLIARPIQTIRALVRAIRGSSPLQPAGASRVWLIMGAHNDSDDGLWVEEQLKNLTRDLPSGTHVVLWEEKGSNGITTSRFRELLDWIDFPTVIEGAESSFDYGVLNDFYERASRELGKSNSEEWDSSDFRKPIHRAVLALRESGLVVEKQEERAPFKSYWYRLRADHRMTLSLAKLSVEKNFEEARRLLELALDDQRRVHDLRDDVLAAEIANSADSRPGAVHIVIRGALHRQAMESSLAQKLLPVTQVRTSPRRGVGVASRYFFATSLPKSDTPQRQALLLDYLLSYSLFDQIGELRDDPQTRIQIDELIGLLSLEALNKWWNLLNALRDRGTFAAASWDWLSRQPDVRRHPFWPLLAKKVSPKLASAPVIDPPTAQSPLEAEWARLEAAFRHLRSSAVLLVFDRDDSLMKAVSDTDAKGVASSDPLPERMASALHGAVKIDPMTRLAVISGGRISTTDSVATKYLNDDVRKKLYVMGDLASHGRRPKVDHSAPDDLFLEDRMPDNVKASLQKAIETVIRTHQSELTAQGIDSIVPIYDRAGYITCSVADSRNRNAASILGSLIEEHLRRTGELDSLGVKVLWSSNAIDIGHTDKAMALEALIRELQSKGIGLSRAEILRRTMAVGDSNNDLLMLNLVAEAGGIALWVGHTPPPELHAGVIRLTGTGPEGARQAVEMYNRIMHATIKVGVAGATGFVGSQLIKRLLGRTNVFVDAWVLPGSNRKDSIPRSESVHVRTAEFLDLQEMKAWVQNNDVLFDFCHWSKIPTTPEPTTAEKFKSNVLAVAYRSELSKQYRKRLIFPSSSTVYRFHRGDLNAGLKEDDLLLDDATERFVQEAVDKFSAYTKRVIDRPQDQDDEQTIVHFLNEHPLPNGDLYALTKLIGERLVLANENSLVLRFAEAYGPEEMTPKAIPLILRAVIGGADQVSVRDDLKQYIFSGDVMRVLEASMDVALQPEKRVINVPGPAVLDTFNRIAPTIKTLFSSNITFVRAPGLNNPEMDDSRLKEIFGFSAETRLEEGLRQTHAWWNSHLTATESARTRSRPHRPTDFLTPSFVILIGAWFSGIPVVQWITYFVFFGALAVLLKYLHAMSTSLSASAFSLYFQESSPDDFIEWLWDKGFTLLHHFLQAGTDHVAIEVVLSVLTGGAFAKGIHELFTFRRVSVDFKKVTLKPGRMFALEPHQIFAILGAYVLTIFAYWIAFILILSNGLLHLADFLTVALMTGLINYVVMQCLLRPIVKRIADPDELLRLSSEKLALLGKTPDELKTKAIGYKFTFKRWWFKDELVAWVDEPYWLRWIGLVFPWAFYIVPVKNNWKSPKDALKEWLRASRKPNPEFAPTRERARVLSKFRRAA